MDIKQIERARKALDDMDDFARMSCGVDAFGPRKVLEDFITAACYADPLYQAMQDFRADVLSGIDGLDNDQINAVLGTFDNYMLDEPAAAAGAAEVQKVCPYCGSIDDTHDANYPHPRVATAQAYHNDPIVQGMADCMDMVRQELIEAGVIGADVAPMFIANAVVAKLAAAVQAQEPAAWKVGDDVFDTLTEAKLNVRNPGLKPEPLYRAPVPEAAQQNGGLVRAALLDLLSPALERAASSGAVSFDYQSEIATIFARGRQALAQSAFDAAPDNGPGTASARLNWILDELGRLFPGARSEYGAAPPELAYFEQIRKSIDSDQAEFNRKWKEQRDRAVAAEKLANERLTEYRALALKLAHSEIDADGWRRTFKNFHRSLCARFGYVHDEVDWKRDQASLEEHIAAKVLGADDLAVVARAGTLMLTAVDFGMTHILHSGLDSPNRTRYRETGNGLMAIYERAAPTKPAGHCAEGDRCVCGGDLPRIREGCGNWRK